MIKKIISGLRLVILKFISKISSSFVRKDISCLGSTDYFVKPAPPYYSQFASANLVSQILNKEIKATDDSEWKSFGFATKKDYEFWSWRLCGLIGVKMVLDVYNKASSETVASLTNIGVELGGYDVANDIGWFPIPLVKLAKQFGIDGKVYRALSIEQIAKLIINNKFVIASVDPCVIRGDAKRPIKGSKDGHLVLVWGATIKNGRITGFYIHNPSGRTLMTQKKAFIPVHQFTDAFAGRGFSLFI